MTRKKWKNWPQKLLIIGPDPFISVQPRPQPRIDFSYYEISGPDICSLICGLYYKGRCLSVITITCPFKYLQWKSFSIHNQLLRWKSKHQYVSPKFNFALSKKKHKNKMMHCCTLLQICFYITWFYTQWIFTVKNEKQVTNDTKSIQISIQCKIITM